MPESDGSGANGAARDLSRSGERWLRWLHAELDGRGGSPRARLLELWDVLEAWFASEGFTSSLPARAAGALRPEPGDELAAAIATHRRAVRALLQDLAEDAGAADPDALAAHLHVLLEGAVAAALIDGHPTVARTARALTQLALDGEEAGAQE